MAVGGQKGNQNRRKDKLIESALRRELVQDPEKALKIAQKMIQLAIDGDTTAATYVRDSVDGKPHQSVDVEHDVGETLALMNQEELRAAVAARLAPFKRGIVPDLGTSGSDGDGGDPRIN